MAEAGLVSEAASLVAQLAAAGTPPELLGAVAEALFAGELGMKAISERRDADRQRKANQRSREVTGQDETGADPSLDKKVSQTHPKIKSNQVPPFIPPIMAAWNDMAGRHKLTKIQSVAGKRRKAVAARFAEHGLEGVLRAISGVPRSDHWLGANGWKGNFDSLMRPDHCQRFIELADESVAQRPNEPMTAEQLRSAIRYHRDNDNEAKAQELEAELRGRAA
jgi:hypothetical protein